MWKLHNFSVIHILREIKIGESRISKSAILHIESRVASFLHFLHDAKNVKAKNLSQKMGAKNAIKENYHFFHEFRLNLA